jgi:hypothetical protein
MESLGALEPVDRKTEAVRHRPAQVYRVRPGVRGTLSLASKNLEVKAAG